MDARSRLCCVGVLWNEGYECVGFMVQYALVAVIVGGMGWVGAEMGPDGVYCNV